MTDGAEKPPRRRLPVLQANPPDPEEPERSPAMWMLLAGVATVLVWTFTAGVVNAVVQRVAPEVLWVVVVVNLLAFAIAIATGAFLLGAHARATTRQHAQVVGVVVAVLGVGYGLSAQGAEFGLTWILSTLLLVVVGVVSARVGFTRGRRRLP